MAKISDTKNPSFVHWPIVSSRTGFQPVNVPLVLVVPFARDPISNAEISNSSISNLKFFIEDAPGLVPVAGFEHKGIFIPDFERFTRSVSTQELLNVKIDITGLPFFDKETGALKEFSDAQPGDQFEYTQIRGVIAASGPRDRIDYYQGFDYYDLSSFTIATVELKPYGNYRFSWQCDYFNRVFTPENELFCIDINDKRLARFSMIVAHPGEIHQMMIEQTPDVYFEGKPLDKDNLVKFYRPFADALNDIFDEQSLLYGINFIERIPAQYMPYLAYLLGWDLPFFPGSSDKIRRAVLRNARHLQQLKGSKRVIRELFELFGFTIDIVNLWYQRDDKKFVGPGEINSPIDIQTICQTEVLLANYSTNGFGGIDIPLLFRPDSDITIDAWLVDNGSSADSQFNDLLNRIDLDPEGLMSTVCPSTSDGFIISQPLQDSITEPTVGYSQVLVTQRLGTIDDILTDDAPLAKYGVSYDFDKNIIRITFDHFIEFNNQKLFIFATYKRKKIILPPSLSDLRSNRFDIQILLNRMSGEAPNSQLLDFLLDFIFKLKAFHSILRKIIFTVQLTDIYSVTDMCLGGQISQSPGTDLGELQTLPPIIPINSDGCNEDVFKRGFKDSDFALRDEILRGLKEEHAAWKALDGTHDLPSDPLIESLLRVSPNKPTEDICEFTEFGQDRIIANGRRDFDHTIDDREKLCDDTNNIADNCFKGRVNQDIIVDRILKLPEIVRCRPCSLMTGIGYYYLRNFENTPISTGALDLSNIKNLRLSHLTDAIIRMANSNLHYTSSPGLTNNDISNDKLAIRRPSLEIDKDNMFFPGHRFIFMANLETDFTSSEYQLRPWDFEFGQCIYPEDITPESLNAHLDIDTIGDEILIYNSLPYKKYGNGLDPDIISMSDHESISFVTHQIFTSAISRSEIDQSAGMLEYTTLSSVCLGDEYSAIFKSATNDCVCDISSSFAPVPSSIEGTDFIDGYPSLFGVYSFSSDDFNFKRNLETDDDYITALNLSVDSGTSTPDNLLFKLGSGIRVAEPNPSARFYRPYRLDCDCLIFDCNNTNPTAIDRCHIDQFIDQDGELDLDCDKIEINREMELVENYGACSSRLMTYPETISDGSSPIPNMLTFDLSKITLISDGKFPTNGEFVFMDDYGIIYEASFEIDSSRIDITTKIKDPRVWGDSPQGVVSNNRVFRRGIISICREISEASLPEAKLLASGCTQDILVFQTTFGCGDRRPSDPFAYHLDCGITDDIEFELICGPGLGSNDTQWCSIIEDSSGNVSLAPSSNQCLYWIDVWNNDETIVTNCSTTG